MSGSLFKSGPWVGFFLYEGHSQRFLMDLRLNFRDGRIDGDGADGVNTFVIAGFYDTKKMECGWEKIYPTHTVNYHGYRDGKGIWGQWKLQKYKGGFHIWPLSEGGPPDLSQREEEEEIEQVNAQPLVVGPASR